MVYMTVDLPESGLRLVRGDHPYEGKVEVFFDGQWGAVCDDKFDAIDSEVVCRELGFRYEQIGYNAGRYGLNFSDIMVQDITCNGNENYLVDCIYGNTESSCQTQGVVISCRIPNNGDVRLVGSHFANKGFIEIYIDRKWNRICNDDVTDTTAHVVCKQLGYRNGLIDSYELANTLDIERISLNRRCIGSERNILDCRVFGHYTPRQCSEQTDKLIVCENEVDYEENGDVRLVGSDLLNEGYVELYNAAQWTRVCADDVTDAVAIVICKQLGFK
uniref:Neurotrypsin-like n=1 Tax=Saccoglossus kowalevskii TaxID=10224 RepID=A0ABM0LU97_SACKO|nr:PREDICTED: neurotrypsin-like [Saccoglossus kowalevskii]